MADDRIPTYPRRQIERFASLLAVTSPPFLSARWQNSVSPNAGSDALMPTLRSSLVVRYEKVRGDDLGVVCLRNRTHSALSVCHFELEPSHELG